ncbi:MAG: YeeE/YedE thiosulfate transporter family protein [Rhodobacteraceae bacterium]|nr:YeeE/YedE thiosulfate transporter family protein [Paracoccaceae bacterium]
MLLRRGSLTLAAAALVAAVSIFVGLRYGLLLAVGLGFGLVLEGLRFGFAGPWRAMILHRNPAGLLGQLLAIALVAIVALPLLAVRGDELSGAQGPIGWAMAAAAFFFGMAMQVLLACGSGTLVNAGSGNPVGLVSLPFFALGSFFGAYHLFWWTGLGSLPPVTLTGLSGTAVTLAALALVAGILLLQASPDQRRLPRRIIVAAALLACLALLNLVVSGQPWGIVYGLGLTAAKSLNFAGMDLSGSTFWTTASSVDRLSDSILTDTTSLTNIGIVFGAFGVSAWRVDGLSQKLPRYQPKAWISMIIGGFVLGYCARLAFGCNVGAFFSGIATGSLHGWVWFAAAFGGAFIGVRLRPILGLEGAK